MYSCLSYIPFHVKSYFVHGPPVHEVSKLHCELPTDIHLQHTRPQSTTPRKMSPILRQLHRLRLNPSSSPTRLALLRRYSTKPPQQPQYQAPSTSASTERKPNAHAEFYRSGTGRAVAWNFLVAMATFQVLYWGWLKLESLEVKREKLGEVGRLEGLVGVLKEKVVDGEKK